MSTSHLYTGMPLSAVITACKETQAIRENFGGAAVIWSAGLTSSLLMFENRGIFAIPASRVIT